MNKNILQKAIDKYGTEAQQDMVIEECSELIKEILKYRRAVKLGVNQALLNDCKLHIADEMADVEIMLEQLKMIFNCKDVVDERIEYKVNRLKERLEV